MSEKYNDFEDFLQEQHIIENPHMIKDQIVCDFNDWLGNLETDEWIEFGDKYAKTKMK